MVFETYPHFSILIWQFPAIVLIWVVGRNLKKHWYLHCADFKCLCVCCMTNVHSKLIVTIHVYVAYLTLTIPSLARQRCLSSWGPLRTPWFFCNFSTLWCGRLLKLRFLGFRNYNSVIQALLASNNLCWFISTEVSQ